MSVVPVLLYDSSDTPSNPYPLPWQAQLLGVADAVNRQFFSLTRRTDTTIYQVANRYCCRVGAVRSA